MGCTMGVNPFRILSGSGVACYLLPRIMHLVIYGLLCVSGNRYREPDRLTIYLAERIGVLPDLPVGPPIQVLDRKSVV